MKNPLKLKHEKTAPTLTRDILAMARLGVDAVEGVTDMVEALHRTIVTLAGLTRHVGLAGERRPSSLVYGTIRKVNRLVGKGLDAQLNNYLDDTGIMARPLARHAVVSALNGVIGDRLHAQGSPLAIRMSLRYAGQSLRPDDIAPLLHQSKGKVLLMLHGLCMNDMQWQRQGQDHGKQLADTLGYVPLYLHYNTGLHISQNGRELAALLESLFPAQGPLTELHMLCHSMGGLVARSACHYAGHAGQAWANSLENIVFLGSPHQGAPLEKGGNWLGQLLTISPYSAPFVPLATLRSAGITDLRHGSLCDEDWQGKDRFAEDKKPHPLPLPSAARCFTLAGEAGESGGTLARHVIGDGLVPVKSALGWHSDNRRNLNFANENQRVIKKINHMQLLNDPRVYQMLQHWFSDRESGRTAL
ncbi:hypothetical protein P2G88_18685 [Aliiglaciecola sp. CAU 1673]|uniref:esterase/lipase family protein n=1 Tax=Aliiglaciecola sp. CAU 1673 TaxID=3032595 RepID=UPI0023DC59D4|nr:hypothetical protein [Aliiglaciecola sp. CAU 1673]MDF2180288.1 hypothetical protein [Aliiglaciecola sp. CAU 1673]